MMQLSFPRLLVIVVRLSVLPCRCSLFPFRRRREAVEPFDLIHPFADIPTPECVSPRYDERRDGGIAMMKCLVMLAAQSGLNIEIVPTARNEREMVRLDLSPAFIGFAPEHRIGTA